MITLSYTLLADLHQLSHADKLRVVQTLINGLAAEDLPELSALKWGQEYESWSPHEAFEAAKALNEALEAHKREGRSG